MPTLLISDTFKKLEETKSILQQVVKGSISLNDLKEYLAKRFANPAPFTDTEREIVGELYIAIAELDRGHRSEEYINNLAFWLLDKASRTESKPYTFCTESHPTFGVISSSPSTVAITIVL